MQRILEAKKIAFKEEELPFVGLTAIMVELA